MEYYSNEFEDDIKNGVVDGLIVEPIDPNDEKEELIDINGDTFTKPKLVNEFYINNREQGKWSVSKNEKGLKPPVKLEEYRNEIGYPCVRATWTATYSGQFELIFTGEKTKYKKIIVVDTRYISSKILKDFINFDNKDVLFIYSTSLVNNSYTLK